MSERIGKYLTVREYPNPHRLTRIWDVLGSDESKIGEVRWYPSWRQYTYWPSPSTVMNPTCMDDLSKFVRGKTQAHMEALAATPQKESQ